MKPLDLFPEQFRRPIKHAVWAGIVTAVASLFLNQYYRSTVSILPAGPSGEMGISAVAAAIEAAPQTDPSENYVDILRSRLVGEQLLRKTYTFKMGWGRFGTPTVRTETLLHCLGMPDMDKGMEALPMVMKATRDLQSGVTRLSVETRSRELSQQVAQDAVAFLQSYLTTQRQTKGGNKAAFIRGRLEEVTRQYLDSEEAFRRFLETNRNFQQSGDPLVRLKGERLESDLMLRRQVVATLTINLEQALQQEKDDTPVLNVLDPGELPIEKSGPTRSFLVLIAMLLVGGASWLWSNRAVLKLRLGHSVRG